MRRERGVENEKRGEDRLEYTNTSVKLWEIVRKSWVDDVWKLVECFIASHHFRLLVLREGIGLDELFSFWLLGLLWD